MFEILDNISISVFLVNSESVLLLAFVKYILYSHCTQNCIFLYFLETKNPILVPGASFRYKSKAKNFVFVTKNCSKSFYVCVFIFSKKQHN